MPHIHIFRKIWARKKTTKEMIDIVTIVFFVLVGIYKRCNREMAGVRVCACVSVASCVYIVHCERGSRVCVYTIFRLACA